jgi:myosin-5
MKYLATLSQFGEDAASSNQVEQQVLQSNPILESFGNARTVRNDNSSRFGKFIEIQFQSSSLTGASIETYLLEKVRLITQSYNERNFHIFYEILSGFSEEQREEYFIFDKHYEDFNMLNQGVEDRREGVEDEDTFQELMNAFESLDGTGFTHQNIKDIFTVTCLCLHLSNVQVIPNANNTNEDGSSIQTEEHLKAVLELLGVSYDQFNTAICYFSIVAGKEHHKRCRNVLKAQRAIHGLIKACYASLFTFLVQRINSSFVSSSSSSSSLAELELFFFFFFFLFLGDKSSSHLTVQIESHIFFFVMEIRKNIF